MPITYTIINDFTEIGTCEGLPITEQGRAFVLVPSSYLGTVSVGDTLVSPDGQYLKIYMDAGKPALPQKSLEMWT